MLEIFVVQLEKPGFNLLTSEVNPELTKEPSSYITKVNSIGVPVGTLIEYLPCESKFPIISLDATFANAIEGDERAIPTELVTCPLIVTYVAALAGVGEEINTEVSNMEETKDLR